MLITKNNIYAYSTREHMHVSQSLDMFNEWDVFIEIVCKIYAVFYREVIEDYKQVDKIFSLALYFACDQLLW